MNFIPQARDRSSLSDRDRLRNHCAAVAAIGVSGAAAAGLFAPSRSFATLCLLIAGATIGSLLIVRIDDRNALPLSYATVVVLVASFQPIVAILSLAFSCVLSELIRDRLQTAAARFARIRDGLVALAAVVAYRGAFRLLGEREQLGVVLAAIATTCCAVAATDAMVRMVADGRRARDAGGVLIVRRLPSTLTTDRGRRAWVAIASSGMLMAVGERGVGGAGHLGVWGPLLFAIPLFAAWYSFERIDAMRRTHQQTIEALAMAPEFAGLVPRGHAARVAAVSRSMGMRLGFAPQSLATLETAAWLHHLGAVTLDDPSQGAPIAPSTTVSHVTADMLRSIDALAPAGEVVARAGSRRSFTFLDARGSTAALVLQYANRFDEAVYDDSVDRRVAIEGFRDSGQSMTDDERSVIDALEFATSGMA